ncbi:MAG: thiamine diphosphokinase [Rectinemataceae bacterium]|nr:thiamine diphosphokinase [Rectinemataceae bacterium]
MEALLITGGQCPPPEFLKRLAARANLVIAADSGLDAARGAEIHPDIVVGDFDSLSDLARLDSLPPENILTFPRDKDDTDTEIALQTAWNNGSEYLILAGGGGGRLDHLLGVFALFARRPAPREWHTGGESVYFLGEGESATFGLPVGSVVSVFPAGNEGSSGMSSSGLKWPLDGLIWTQGYYGISNESIGSQVHISAGSSSLLVILPLGCERLPE